MKFENNFSRREILQAFAAVSLAPIIQPMNSISSLFLANIAGQSKLVAILEKAKKENWKKRDFGTVVGLVGTEFLGIPYVGKTLDQDALQEACVVTLDGLDCVTFFESSLAIARMIFLDQEGSQNLLKQVTHTRYRNGVVNGYPSRLHYTADWFYDNERKRVIRNITSSLPGAIKYEKLINFMSNHPKSYAQLDRNPKLVPEIAKQEAALNKRNLTYVPKSLVAKMEEKLKTGDIVGITTTIEGIDCSHTGLVFVDSTGVRRFMHASQTQKKVILDERLSDYLNSISKHTGIMIARPIKPKRA